MKGHETCFTKLCKGKTQWLHRVIFGEHVSEINSVVKGSSNLFSYYLIQPLDSRVYTKNSYLPIHGRENVNERELWLSRLLYTLYERIN